MSFSDDIEFTLPTPQSAVRSGMPKLPARFFTIVKEHPGKSKEEGRPICVEVEMIEIRIPGSVKDVFHEKVSDKWRQEYAEEYRHWKATQKQLVEGTPLEQCSLISRTRAMELRLLGILTCETYIQLTDAQMQNCGMGTRTEIAKVKAWMDAAKDSALVTRLAQEKEENQAQIADLQRQIKELAEMLQEKSKPKRPTLSLAAKTE